MNLTNPTLFQLKQVSFTYAAVNTPSYVALKEINLGIRKGEFVAIIGPSGSGKSTLMHLLGIMADPTEGSLLINGELVSNLPINRKAELRNQTIGFLFQQFFLLPQLTVLENIILPAEYRKNSGSEEDVRSAALQLIKRFGLSGQENKKPANLSGGQRQRVALCRALIMNPEVLMCDEPTGALDTSTAIEVLNTLAELHAEGRTIIVITHDPEVACRAHRILRIVDGNIVADESNRPTNETQPKVLSASATSYSAKESLFRLSRLTHLATQMFKPTWQSLKTQRLRTVLTMTGLLLGVASVFIMLTLTGRVGKIFEDFFATQGSRKAFIHFDYRLADKTGAPRWRGLNVRTELPILNAQIQSFGRLDAKIDTSVCKILSATANIDRSLFGVNSLIEGFENGMRLAKGRFPMPSEFEIQSPARIALLGSDAATKLFPANLTNKDGSNSAIGQKIIVRGCDFEGVLNVVGILQPIDTLFFNDVNSSIYVPTQTLLSSGAPLYQRQFTATPNVGVSPTWFAKHVIGLLKIKTANKFPFRYFAAEQELEKFNLMMGILTGLTLVIGTLCTLIGGIGVMNIMMVNVHERVQEIGIRKAVGAKNSHIRVQFLLESMGLCFLSGVLGLAVGITVSIAAFKVAQIFLPKVENLHYQFDLLALFVSLVVSLGVGIVFGTWPARRAAELDVVDALKQE